MRAPERRRQLLEVAANLFAERGYRGATTAELAARAGVAEPILYRHFESKLDLFLTLVDEVGAEVIRVWSDRLEGVDEPARRLHVLLEGNPATDARGQGVYRVIFHAITEPGDEPPIAEAITSHLARLHAFVRAELTALQRAGAVRDDEPASALAWLLLHVAIGAGMTAPLPVPGRSASVRRSLSRLLEDLVRAG